jgi:hypothetical protein
MNSLEARSKAAAGRGAATNVGRVFRGFVNEAEEREVSDVSSATDAGVGGGGGKAFGLGPAPGGPRGLRRESVSQSWITRLRCQTSDKGQVPGRTGQA